jgi:hypothetical protein
MPYVLEDVNQPRIEPGVRFSSPGIVLDNPDGRLPLDLVGSGEIEVGNRD